MFYNYTTNANYICVSHRRPHTQMFQSFCFVIMISNNTWTIYLDILLIVWYIVLVTSCYKFWNVMVLFVIHCKPFVLSECFIMHFFYKLCMAFCHELYVPKILLTLLVLRCGSCFEFMFFNHHSRDKFRRWQIDDIFMPPTSKKLEGAYCFWVVRPSVRPVRPSVHPSVRHAFWCIA